MKQYAQARTEYRGILARLPPEEMAYWALELEYCKCLLEGFAGDNRMMKDLVTRVRQLRYQFPTMGGLSGEFEQIEIKAKGLLK